LAVRKWARVWRLTWGERLLLLQAVALLPTTALALRLAGFRRCQAALARVAPLTAGRDAADGRAINEGRRVARMVDTAARHGPCRAACLTRSLLLWALLRRRGIDGDLRIGVRKEAGRFQAHAWVELRGTVLNDGRDVHERFRAFGRAIVPAGGLAL
jgi:hypothetical protein